MARDQSLDVRPSWLTARTQIEFELEFFGALLAAEPNHLDALRHYASNLALSGRLDESRDVDERIVGLRPHDPWAHYNFACSLARTQQLDAAFRTLRRAIDLGYRDFRFIREDRDLDALRDDPRFCQLLHDYEDY